MTNDILFSVEKHLGLITLNRVKALNALNLHMVQAIYQQLLDWQRDETIHAVVIQASEGKAFCAGGDVRWLYEMGRADTTGAMRFFDLEYSLNQLIHEYPKPYIALMDGITMGGGVGISLHGSHPVASERFVFAMPETTIGFFPDIGASYLLARCPAYAGVYLGLTGQKLNAREALQLGLVRHVVHSDDMPAVLNALIKSDLSENASSRVSDCLQPFTAPSMPSAFDDYHLEMNACFQHASVSAILQALQAGGSRWCMEVWRLLQQRSPLSLSVTLEQLKRAQHLSFSACLEMDRILVRHFMQGSDFYEGVRALLVDKDQHPHWQPAHLDTVQATEVQAYFV